MSAEADNPGSSPLPPPQQDESTTRRRSSIFDRFRKSHDTKTDALAGDFDTASTLTANSTNTNNNSRIPFLSDRRSSPPKAPKERKESISDRGAFRIEYTESGIPIAIENKDWPPGTSYKTSMQIKQMQAALAGKDGGSSAGLGSFYEGQGAVIPGGENLGNTGPDPDWVPGLSDKEREELKKSRSGRYVF